MPALCTLCSLLFGLASAQEQWAVLIASSKGWANYGQQATVCHARGILRARGFKEDRVITMIYDDVAHSAQNPFPGKLFNAAAASLEHAEDVYEGCNPDYTGADITPETFLAVLQGDEKAAGGKVLRSGRQDHIFVFMVDHGDAGIVYFGDNAVLHAWDLHKALNDMYAKGMYRRMLFYLEACYSGSMFQLLPSELPVSAVTSANALEESYAVDCSNHSKVGDKKLGVCLGGEFSRAWMGYSMRGDANETVSQLFYRTRWTTRRSHVQRMGQSFSEQLLGAFQGGAPVPVKQLTAPAADAVSFQDMKLQWSQEQQRRIGDSAPLAAELASRNATAQLRWRLDAQVLGAAEELAEDGWAWTPTLMICHRQASVEFGKKCGWSESRLPLSRSLLQLCQRRDQEAVLKGIRTACVATGEIFV